MHILGVERPRTAEKIAAVELNGDHYHQEIAWAAKHLVETGCGDHVYRTQWTSGTTVWWNPRACVPLSLSRREMLSGVRGL